MEMARRLLFGLVIAAPLLGSCLPAFADKPVYNRVSAVSPAGNLARGKQLAGTCLACHGESNLTMGDPPFHAPKLRNQRLTTLFYALQDYRDGRRKSEFMGPVAKGMSDQDMRDLSAYLSARTLASQVPKVLQTLPMADSPGYRKNDQLCSMCHGEAGLGEMDGYPVLAGQHRDYIEHALADYRSGARTNPIMQHFALTLKPEEVGQLAEFFAAQHSLETSQ